jgi:hypothetical protein
MYALPDGNWPAAFKEFPMTEAEKTAWIANLMGGYSQAELEAAFALVAPKPNWKTPINAKLSKSTTVAEIARIKFAIMFFTGSEATFGYGSVKAPGYYATIGA